MNSLDWILIAIALFCVLRGVMRGAVSQVFGIAGVLGGFLVAAHFHQPVADQIKQAFPQFSAAPVLSFIVLFFLTWFCVGFIGFWISRVLKKTGLAFLDRLMGGVIGAAKALALALILISGLTLFLSPRSAFLAQSLLTPHVHEAARYIVRITPENVQKRFEEKRRELERFWIEREEQPKKPERHKREAARI